jgi:uncharacterized protein (TIGR04222 family)
MEPPSVQKAHELMTWNPFDWTAGPFLALYLTIAILLFAWGFLLRSMIGPAARTPTRRLRILELAYLAGAERRLGDAVLLSLISGNGATIDAKGHKITVTDQTPLTTLVGPSVWLSTSSDMTRQQFQTAVKPIVERVRGRLQELGYCPTDDQMMSFRMNVLPFIGLLLAFGVTKAFVGAQRHHPIGLLLMLLVLTAFGAIALARRSTRTRAGKEVLKTYQADHARASRAPLDHELLLAVALSGAVVLSGTAYASVYAASRTMSSDGGGSGCGGGGGGGCGGCS